MSRVRLIGTVGCATAFLVVTAPSARIVPSPPLLSNAARTEPAKPAPPPSRSPSREILGTLEVPRLGLRAVVRSGVDGQTLQDGIGHVPETPRPGDRGNAALAAHGDPFFGPLKTIRRGDRMRVRTRQGIGDYRVAGTRIVSPDDQWMLERTTEPALTLITSYPFDHVGDAPKRFVVRATKVKPTKVSKTMKKAPPMKKKKGFWGKLASAFKAEG